MNFPQRNIFRKLFWEEVPQETYLGNHFWKKFPKKYVQENYFDLKSKALQSRVKKSYFS